MTDPTDDELRETARKRLQERRDLSGHVVAYLVVNVAITVVWVMTGGGYFWPGWLIGVWGVGLVLHAWTTLVQRPITSADVDEEMERMRRRSGRARA